MDKEIARDVQGSVGGKLVCVWGDKDGPKYSAEVGGKVEDKKGNYLSAKAEANSDGNAKLEVAGGKQDKKR